MRKGPLRASGSLPVSLRLVGIELLYVAGPTGRLRPGLSEHRSCAHSPSLVPGGPGRQHEVAQLHRDWAHRCHWAQCVTPLTPPGNALPRLLAQIPDP